MDADIAKLATQLVSEGYIAQGLQSLRQHGKKLKVLLGQRRIPEEAWPEREVEALLHTLASMDTNNFPGIAGGGEREARILSPMVWLYDPWRSPVATDIVALTPATAGCATALLSWPWNRPIGRCG